jgi:hypothetical protein
MGERFMLPGSLNPFKTGGHRRWGASSGFSAELLIGTHKDEYALERFGPTLTGPPQIAHRRRRNFC